MEGTESYDPQLFAKIAAVEERHFWFCARSRIIASAVKQVVASLQRGYRVIEVGCGTGVVLRELARVCPGGEVMGMDLYPEAVAFASAKVSCPVVVGDVARAPQLGQFDVVGFFDVLEHLTNDREILRGLNSMLKPGGALVLTVPAHMSLWSYFDVASRHCRRYDSAGLTGALRETGFEVEYLTQFMMILFPLVWLVRRIHQGNATTDRSTAAKKAATELQIVPILNGFLKLILSAEAFAIGRRWRLPIGTSLLVVARKN